MKLSSSLFDIPFINNVLFYDTITSTNDKAKELAKRGSVHGTLVVGKYQTNGRGRLGRGFESKSDDGLYMSLMLRPKVALEHLSRITLVTALAVAKAIAKFCDIAPNIKWPNDITINGKKLVGILTEAGSDYVVIGIGINVNNEYFSKNISDIATSLYMVTGKKIQKAKLLSSILTELNLLYQEFINNENLEFMLSEYNSMLDSLHNDVYIIPHHVSQATQNPYQFYTDALSPMLCMGINKEGDLICKDSQGLIHYVNSGEVSLRHKYF